ETLAQVCAAPLERGWVPGQRAAYHAASGWIVLGELLRRLGGRPCAQVLREELLLPLGMADSWVGMPGEVYRANIDRLAGLYNTQGEMLRPVAHWDAEAAVVACRPWAGGRGPMRELGRFYEALLAGGGPLVAPATVRHFTSRHRAGLFDHTFGKTIDWGLGFALDSKHHGPDIPYGYGAHASPGTYGHGGRQCCAAFADPERGLVVALGFTGMPGEGAHDRRVRSFLEALYRDLDLV
ncbi:MAG: beta-lactamase family protein, partial [Candidatus Latescibacteria bacterium]|nr:beta-lactamase family protein [Candidatus Latescibacterota bacterium]